MSRAVGGEGPQWAREALKVEQMGAALQGRGVRDISRLRSSISDVGRNIVAPAVAQLDKLPSTGLQRAAGWLVLDQGVRSAQEVLQVAGRPPVEGAQLDSVAKLAEGHRDWQQLSELLSELGKMPPGAVAGAQDLLGKESLAPTQPFVNPAGVADVIGLAQNLNKHQELCAQLVQQPELREGLLPEALQWIRLGAQLPTDRWICWQTTSSVVAERGATVLDPRTGQIRPGARQGVLDEIGRLSTLKLATIELNAPARRTMLETGLAAAWSANQRDMVEVGQGLPPVVSQYSTDVTRTDFVLDRQAHPMAELETLDQDQQVVTGHRRIVDWCRPVNEEWVTPIEAIANQTAYNALSGVFRLPMLKVYHNFLGGYEMPARGGASIQLTATRDATGEIQSVQITATSDTSVAREGAVEAAATNRAQLAMTLQRGTAGFELTDITPTLSAVAQ